jgi:hypothetical protein
MHGVEVIPDRWLDGLELILGGGIARGAVQMQGTREALLAYCAQDTRATMGVLEWLRARGDVRRHSARGRPVRAHAAANGWRSRRVT